MKHLYNFLQEQLQINLLQQTHLTVIPPTGGGGGSMSSSNKASKASLSNLQQQQQQIMAQMQITQQALMLGQNIDAEDVPIKPRGKEMPGILSETGYPLGSSFPLNNKKTSKQVRISRSN